MRTKTWLNIILIAGLVLGLSGESWHSAGAASGAIGPAVPEADLFGYALEATMYNWVEINSGTPVSFVSNSFATAGPLPIGFTFKYYENAYTQLYVTTNGLILFDRDLVFTNDPLPYTAAPNNLIAPLWSLTQLLSGHVYIKTDLTSSPKKCIIEWDNVGNPLDPMTFQAILYETGDIVFQYKELNADLTEYTIGIEDPDGLTGVAYLYNAPGLSPSSAVIMHRPSPRARVKVLPKMQGGFLYSGKAAYDLTVKNIGDKAADRYELKIAASQPGWRTDFYARSTGAPLTDTNGDGTIDTGPIPIGGSKEIALVVTGPDDADEGDYNLLTLTALSTLAGAASTTAQVQSAVPLQFTQVFVNEGIRLGQFWKVNYIERGVLDVFSGATLSLEAIALGDYLVAWEKSTTESGRRHIDIYYSIINRVSGVIGSITLLTNGEQLLNQDAAVLYADAHNPTITSGSDGKVLVAWNLQQQKSAAPLRGDPTVAPDDDFVKNSNVLFNILDAANRQPILSQPENVTKDNAWYGSLTNHTYNNPIVAITGHGRYFVCWGDQLYEEAGTSSSTIKCSIYTYQNNQLALQTGPITIDQVTGSMALYDLTLVPIGADKMLMAYTETDDLTEGIVYTLWNEQGVKLVDRTKLAGVQGSQPEVVTFGGTGEGMVLLTWLSKNRQVAYAYLDPGTDYSLVAGYPKYLDRVGDRVPGSLSVTLDVKNRAVLTWLDTDDNEFMYYAVLNAAQNLLTPPMIFLTDRDTVKSYTTSDEGYGNAAYLGVYRVYFPVEAK